MRQFTEIEIKMAEKAEEIQALRSGAASWGDGDYFAHGGKVDFVFPGMFGVVTDVPFIWLPLEHQLWGMMNYNIWDATLILSDFLYYLDGTNEIGSKYKTWWEIIISLTMHELYGKRWDDDKEDWVEDWVKEA